MAPLDGGHRRTSGPVAVRRAGMRDVRLGGRSVRLRRLGRGSRGGRRQRRPRPLPAPRRVPRCRRRRGVRRAPPRTSEPHGALRFLRQRSTQTSQRGFARRGGARHRVGACRVGPRRPVVPPGVHVTVPPRRQPRGLGRVQRATTPDDLAGKRRALPGDVRRHRRHRRGADGELPDARRACPRRPPRPLARRRGSWRR